jgi:hypothetical protein
VFPDEAELARRMARGAGSAGTRAPVAGLRHFDLNPNISIFALIAGHWHSIFQLQAIA